MFPIQKANKLYPDSYIFSSRYNQTTSFKTESTFKFFIPKNLFFQTEFRHNSPYYGQQSIKYYIFNNGQVKPTQKPIIAKQSVQVLALDPVDERITKRAQGTSDCSCGWRSSKRKNRKHRLRSYLKVSECSNQVGR